MSGMHTPMVRDAHDYTHDELPWIIDRGEDEGSHARLMRYLAGGGMSAFGRTLEQERTRRRHRNFWCWMGVLGTLWLVFYIF